MVAPNKVRKHGQDECGVFCIRLIKNTRVVASVIRLLANTFNYPYWSLTTGGFCMFRVRGFSRILKVTDALLFDANVLMK